MQIAFRVDIQLRDEEGPTLRLANGHTWMVDDVFTYRGREWTVDAVLVKFLDGVPYPAQELVILVAGDRDTRSSVVVDADDVILVESDDVERKRYVVELPGERYAVDLSEAEHEQLRRLHHGHVSITPIDTLDFEDINEWLESDNEQRD